MNSSRKANTVRNDLSVHLLSARASRFGLAPGKETCVCNDDNTSLSTYSAPGTLSQLVLHYHYPQFTGSERSSHLSKVTQPMERHIRDWSSSLFVSKGPGTKPLTWYGWRPCQEQGQWCRGCQSQTKEGQGVGAAVERGAKWLFKQDWLGRGR